MPQPTVIASCGSGGSASALAVTVPPVPYAEIVDTNGCGDAFVGGFLSCLVGVDADDHGAKILECVVEGHRCAGLILRQRGCNLSRSHVAVAPRQKAIE